jgi:hypothetical protein
LCGHGQRALWGLLVIQDDLREAQIFPTIRRLETVTNFVGGLPRASEQKED